MTKSAVKVFVRTRPQAGKSTSLRCRNPTCQPAKGVVACLYFSRFPGNDLLLILTRRNTLILSILEDQRSIAVQLREKDASQVNNQLEQLSFKVCALFFPLHTFYCVCCAW